MADEGQLESPAGDARFVSRESIGRQAGSVIAVSTVFAAWSFLHVAVPGVNEPHYLCKARATWDPGWCSGDFFLQSKAAHAVFFKFVGWWTGQVSLESVAVGGRLLSCLVLGWGWTRLTRALNFSFVLTVVSALLLCAIALTGNFSGEWILGGFESKVPAWGLGFAATALWLRSHEASDRLTWILMGLLSGLSTAAHPVVGAWFVVAISMAEIGRQLPIVRQQFDNPDEPAAWGASARSLTLMIVVAVIAALPGLLPALQVVQSSDLTPFEAGRANRIQVFMRLKHHLDPARFPPRAWIHSAILLIVIAWSSRRLRTSQDYPVIRRSLLLLAAALLIAAVGIAIGAHWGDVAGSYQWSGRAFLLKFYPFRLVDVLMPTLAALLLTRVGWSYLNTGLLNDQPGRQTGFVLTLAVAVLGTAAATRSTAPTGYTAHSWEQWQDACEWLREHTDADSLFVTPRESAGFKWFAERAEFVCYKDCPQDANGILEWRRRMKILSWLRPVTLQRALTSDDLTRLRDETHASHLITRDHHVTDQDPVFNNEVWRVYKTAP